MAYDKEISELKVLESRAGYYVGREMYNEDYEKWFPYIRVSGYTMDKEQAQSILQDALEFKKDIKNISEGNLEVMAGAFHDRLDEDPTFELKRNLTLDSLEMGKEKSMEIER
jgi:hypothetical protein